MTVRLKAIKSALRELHCSFRYLNEMKRHEVFDQMAFELDAGTYGRVIQKAELIDQANRLFEWRVRHGGQCIYCWCLKAKNEFKTVDWLIQKSKPTESIFTAKKDLEGERICTKHKPDFAAALLRIEND